METTLGKVAVAAIALESIVGGSVFSAYSPVKTIDPKTIDLKTIVLRTTSEQKCILLFYPIIPGILLSANLCF
jgi:hypothetical protein